VSYALLKTLHVAGAVLLLGNVTVTGFWALALYRARPAVPFRPVARAIMWADWLFTVVGGALLTSTGMMMARQQGWRLLATPWIVEGLAALGVATLIWLVALLPDQWRMERLAPDDDVRLRRLFLRWSVLGWTATALLFYGLWAMVRK
jgi:uncharacterized membrane protein